MSHTPGPWTYKRMHKASNFDIKRRYCVISPGHQTVAYVFGDFDERHANDTALIAGAPDMYEALNGLVGLCALLLGNDLPANVRHALENNHRVVAAKEALAKVESPSIKEQMGKV